MRRADLYALNIMSANIMAACVLRLPPPWRCAAKGAMDEEASPYPPRRECNLG